MLPEKVYFPRQGQKGAHGAANNTTDATAAEVRQAVAFVAAEGRRAAAAVAEQGRRAADTIARYARMAADTIAAEIRLISIAGAGGCALTSRLRRLHHHRRRTNRPHPTLKTILEQWKTTRSRWKMNC